ncbi:MAG: hypothetical protein KKA19_03125, partial [Candidatus Margulisbacteria bacterium]|nr:hypothetical protein [Candidatus Margulisiibacteriota bacterium]
MSTYTEESLCVFETCPLQYKFKYIDKLKFSIKSIEAFLDEVFLEVIYKIYNEAVTKNLALVELMDFYLKTWSAKYNTLGIITRPDRKPGLYLSIGRKAVEMYYEKNHPFNQKKIIGVNKKMLIDIDGAGKYIVEGYVPLVLETKEGILEIHDFKTQTVMPARAEFDNDCHLSLYQMGIQQMFP